MQDIKRYLYNHIFYFIARLCLTKLFFTQKQNYLNMLKGVFPKHTIKPKKSTQNKRPNKQTNNTESTQSR